MTRSTTRNRLSLLGAIMGACLAASAAAQSPTAGLMGEAAPGSIAVVQNVSTGFKREIKVKANGRYALRNLPTGTFSVTIRNADGTTEAPRLVQLRVGSTARVK